MNLFHDNALRMRELRTFAAIAELGSFSAAAEALDYTQSAVSHQIANLERTLGVRLLDRPRGARGVTLTSHGKRLLGHARAILERLELAEADMRSAAAEGTPPLRVGTFQSVAMHILPEVLRRYRRDQPDLDVELTETAGDDALL
ncbi:MAG TPA: LysR family transcriptional regulator, partial [Conexibacter sp.]|nr:LysR family transcriptional regulator [Conexibacter sp.]